MSHQQDCSNHSGQDRRLRRPKRVILEFQLDFARIRNQGYCLIFVYSLHAFDPTLCQGIRNLSGLKDAQRWCYIRLKSHSDANYHRSWTIVVNQNSHLILAIEGS